MFDNRTSISWFGVLFGLLLGIGAGLLYTWIIDPVREFNTAPWQLQDEAREKYVIAVVLRYAYHYDLQDTQNQAREQVLQQLRAELRPDQNVGAMLADIACNIDVVPRKVDSPAELHMMGMMEQLYRSLGASGCADGKYWAIQATPTPPPTLQPTPTPSPTPEATKTPQPSPTDLPVVVPTTLTPTALPPGSYVAGTAQLLGCAPDRPGLLEVRVFDRNGEGVPGIPVQVTWSGSEKQVFFTGLKPGKSPGYADFEMEPGRSYSVSLLSAPESEVVISNARTFRVEACEATDDGQTVSSVQSYRVDFQQQFD
jgi:hypothetical protein